MDPLPTDSNISSSTPLVNRRSRFVSDEVRSKRCFTLVFSQDEERSGETQLNISQIFRRSPSPPTPPTNPPEDEQIDREEQLVRSNRSRSDERRTSSLDDQTTSKSDGAVTRRDERRIGVDRQRSVSPMQRYKSFFHQKRNFLLRSAAESSTPVIRKASALSSLIQSNSTRLDLVRPFVLLVEVFLPVSPIRTTNRRRRPSSR